MTSLRLRAVLGPTAALLLAGLLIACGGSNSSANSSPGTANSSPGTTASSADTTSVEPEPTGANPEPAQDACFSLTAEQIGAATGGVYGEGVREGESVREGSACGWILEDKTGGVAIRIVPPVAALAVGTEPVEGFGDQAVCFCSKLLAILGIVTGDTGIHFQVSGVDDSEAGAKAVAELVLKALAP